MLEEQSQNDDSFRIWKRNTPFLYDKMISHVLKWPSLACRNFTTADKDFVVLGTHTSLQESEFIHVYEEGNSFKQYQSIAHGTEINSVDVMPQNNQIIATKMSDLCVFDRTKHATFKLDQRPHPELKHQAGNEGYGLQFSPTTPGLLLTGDSKSLNVYHVTDATENEQLTQKIGPRYSFEQSVEDAVWFKTHDSLIVTAGAQSSVVDIRTNKVALKLPITSTLSCDSHSSLISTLIVANDKHIELLDLRNLETTLHTFKYHNEEVIKCRFSPTHPNIFASTAGNRLIVWDVCKSASMSDDEAPPEVLFLHGGHNARIGDFDFHPTIPFQLTTVDDENICQIFKIATSIVENKK